MRLFQTASQRLIQLAGDVTALTEAVGRVEGGVGRVERGMHKMDEDMQRIARGTQESLLRLKNLQAPNYPYPHLVAVKEIQAAERKTNLWSRLRGVFVMDMTFHFLCPFDMSKVPCGDGGNGYRLRKTRGWVKRISPALQASVVRCAHGNRQSSLLCGAPCCWFGVCFSREWVCVSREVTSHIHV